MAAQPSSSAVRALAMEYKSIQEEPVEGFRVKLVNEDVLFDWEVAIFGPPDTLYQGGYFKVVHLSSLLELSLTTFCLVAGSTEVSTRLSILSTFNEISNQSLASKCLWSE